MNSEYSAKSTELGEISGKNNENLNRINNLNG